MKQEIRIIGGMYRAKKLHFPDVAGLRPTPNRVRETLFNWLMGCIKGSRCLDAFAGSGALGFEAFSRGAAEVVLVEYNPKIQQQLQTLIKEFNTPSLKLVKADARYYLGQANQCFDIIFLDPPFDQEIVNECLCAIVDNALIRSGGLVYLESAKEIALDESMWKKIKSKRAGQVIYSLIEKL